MCANVSETFLHIALSQTQAFKDTVAILHLALRNFQGFHSLTITCLTLLTFAVSRMLWLYAEGSLGLEYEGRCQVCIAPGVAIQLVRSVQC